MNFKNLRYKFLALENTDSFQKLQIHSLVLGIHFLVLEIHFLKLKIHLVKFRKKKLY